MTPGAGLKITENHDVIDLIMLHQAKIVLFSVILTFVKTFKEVKIDMEVNKL